MRFVMMDKYCVPEQWLYTCSMKVMTICRLASIQQRSVTAGRLTCRAVGLSSVLTWYRVSWRAHEPNTLHSDCGLKGDQRIRDRIHGCCQTLKESMK
jgi:hypothetical protein